MHGMKTKMKNSVLKIISVGLGFERHGVELEPVVDEPIAEALGDQLLDRLDFLVAELDDLAGADVDQVVVMLVGDRLEAGTAILEIMLGDEPGFLEQIERAVDGRQRDARDRWRRRGDSSSSTSGWSSAASITWAMTRRWSVMRMPFLAHCSSRVSVWPGFSIGRLLQIAGHDQEPSPAGRRAAHNSPCARRSCAKPSLR